MPFSITGTSHCCCTVCARCWVCSQCRVCVCSWRKRRPSAICMRCRPTTNLRWIRPSVRALVLTAGFILRALMPVFHVQNGVQGGLPTSQSGSSSINILYAALRWDVFRKSVGLPCGGRCEGPGQPTHDCSNSPVVRVHACRHCLFHMLQRR